VYQSLHQSTYRRRGGQAKTSPLQIQPINIQPSRWHTDSPPLTEGRWLRTDRSGIRRVTASSWCLRHESQGLPVSDWSCASPRAPCPHVDAESACSTALAPSAAVRLADLIGEISLDCTGGRFAVPPSCDSRLDVMELVHRRLRLIPQLHCPAGFACSVRRYVRYHAGQPDEPAPYGMQIIWLRCDEFVMPRDKKPWFDLNRLATAYFGRDWFRPGRGRHPPVSREVATRPARWRAGCVPAINSPGWATSASPNPEPERDAVDPRRIVRRPRSVPPRERRCRCRRSHFYAFAGTAQHCLDRGSTTVFTASQWRCRSPAGRPVGNPTISTVGDGTSDTSTSG